MSCAFQGLKGLYKTVDMPSGASSTPEALASVLSGHLIFLEHFWKGMSVSLFWDL